MERLFGTDGVRGVANRKLTAELALDLSLTAAHVLDQAGHFSRSRPVAVVGRDPRASGEFLQAAVVSGLASAGLDVIRLGVLPTPAVAYLTQTTDADLGVMISASHNPMPDNGIKFFDRDGFKLADALEDVIEQRMREDWSRPVGADVGRVRDEPELLDGYIDHLVSTVDAGINLNGIKMVMDCANGAACRTGPEVFNRFGANVVTIHAEPDGININQDCGSTHIEDLRRAVVAEHADVGIAVDGDADRCVAVDAGGTEVDGDQIMAILASGLKQADKLPGDTLVATVMSNLGLIQAMRQQGIEVEQTSVGDRYVLEAMRAGNYVLGGEQSGHVVLSDYATTGDGVLTAVQLVSRMAATGTPLRELASVMQHLPQVLINVDDVDKARTHSDPEVVDAVATANAELGDTGRVLLRPSGTESLVRVMVEAPSAHQAQLVAQRLAAVVRSTLAI
jgi:phosphoglucosamine mutase